MSTFYQANHLNETSSDKSTMTSINKGLLTGPVVTTRVCVLPCVEPPVVLLLPLPLPRQPPGHTGTPLVILHSGHIQRYLVSLIRLNIKVRRAAFIRDIVYVILYNNKLLQKGIHSKLHMGAVSMDNISFSFLQYNICKTLSLTQQF